MRVEELRATLRARGLSTKGKKSELESRLRDDDDQARQVIFAELALKKKEEEEGERSSAVRPKASPRTEPSQRYKTPPIERQRYRNYVVSLVLFNLVYVIVEGVFTFMDQPISTGSLVLVADALDILAPPVILSGYWILLRNLGDGQILPRGTTVLFVQVAGMWAFGKGMHMAANSISRYIKDKQSPVYGLSYFYDETLGHIVFLLAVVVFSTMISVLQAKHPFPEEAAPQGFWGTSLILMILVLSGVMHGFQIFIQMVEGQTPFYIPLLALITVVVVFIWVIPRGIHFRRVPWVTFMSAASFVALILAGVWAYMHNGDMPEFSALGYM